jgi:hypothetical protein
MHPCTLRCIFTTGASAVAQHLVAGQLRSPISSLQSAMQVHTSLQQPLTPLLLLHTLAHRLDVLQWLHTDLQCPWEARFIIRIAAEKGLLPLLQWMWQQRDGAAVDNAYVTCAAAVGGHLPTIIWLHRAQRLRPDDICTRVAHHNHILVLLWLHQQG